MEEAVMLNSGQTVAGVTVPDTKLAREATELIRDRTSDLVYNHSRRVFWWGSLQGGNRGLSFDPELLYIGAMFHDLGLNAEFRDSGRRFEVNRHRAPPRPRRPQIPRSTVTRPGVHHDAAATPAPESRGRRRDAWPRQSCMRVAAPPAQRI
jgi:hypothetical protein